MKTPSVQLAAVCEDTGEEVECKVKDNGDGTFKCIYYPKTPGSYKIHINFMDEPIPQAPVSVTIKPFCDPSKVKAYGPGLTGKNSFRFVYFVSFKLSIKKFPQNIIF